MVRTFDRRTLLALLGGAGLAATMGPTASASDQLTKIIPSSGDAVPVIGLGSWITFNVGRDAEGLAASTRVIDAFFKAGGRMIDSSPMYGSSQATIGHALEKLGAPSNLLAVDKVWTNGEKNGQQQISESLRHWRLPRFSLIQIHNLRDWRTHMPTLQDMKVKGITDYIGVTTSHGRRNGELLEILETQPLDFIQLTYNMTHRQAEERLLPIARERGVAVIVNRPFDGGRLIRAAKRHPFPEWAKGEGFAGWADFLLKFNVSHPAVTCAIPATTKIAHVRENMAACKGRLPDAILRRRMVQLIEDL